MDSLTHVVLGGSLGVAAAGNKLGKKALVLGAVAQSLPDIDFLASFWLDPTRDLLAHRGITHSFLFVILCAPALAYAANRYYPGLMRLREWIGFFALQIFVHILIDAFNAYGVAWFEPFSLERVSFNALFVADPFLTVPVAAAFAFLLFSAQSNPQRKLATHLAWIWTVLYISFAVMNKFAVNSVAANSLVSQQVHNTRYFSTPTPLNTLLWYVVADAPDGSYVGYRSVFDSGDDIDFEFFPRNDSLLTPYTSQEELLLLKRFSEGYYTAEKWGDTLVFNDLRFGQVLGWQHRRSKFVFHYCLNHPASNEMIVQRGRFTGWDGDAIGSFVLRIAGKTVNGRELPGGSKK